MSKRRRRRNQPTPQPAPPQPRAGLPTWLGLGLSVLSGCMWFLACADFDIWPLAWFAMVPALIAIERAPSLRRAVLYGWLTGTVANLGGFYWITGLLTRFASLPLLLGLLGLLLLALYQGTVFLLFAWVVRRLREHSAERLGQPLPMVLVAPLVMVTFELLVPFIFPWYLAITQAWVVPVIQIAELTGPLGVTALLLVVNGALYDVLVERLPRRRWIPAASAAGLLAAALAFGLVRIGQIEARRAEAPSLRVGVVQGNIPFDEKGVARRELAARQLAGLQQKSAELEARRAELILWTESSYPYHIPRDQPGDFDEHSPYKVRRGFDAPLIFGAVTWERGEPDKSPYNSALLLDEDGSFTARFDKIFLLVFGEYIPLYETFPWVRKMLPKQAGHFSRGEEVLTFPFEKDGTTYRLGPMICYEDIVPDFGRHLGVFHPHLLVNVTNDAWFGDTSEPWEHLALSVYRSVEMRTDLVRAVNTGVSAYVSATGEVYAETYAVDPKIDPRGVDGIVEDVALMEGGHGLFIRYGDVFGFLCVAATAFLWLVWPRLPRRRESD